MPTTRTIVITELTDEELDAISDAAVGLLRPDYELAYVDYRDELDDDQVAALLSGDDDREDLVYEAIAEGWSESTFTTAWDYAADAVKEAIKDAGYDDESNPTADAVFDQMREAQSGGYFDEVRFEVENRDTSNVVRDLMRHCGPVAVRYLLDDVDNVDEPWQMDGDEIADVVANLAAQVGIHPGINAAPLDSIMCNCGNGGQVELALMADVEDLYDAIREAKADGRTFTITFTNPDVLVINPYEGSGWCENVTGVVSRPFDPAALRTDKGAAGWGWDDVCSAGGRPFSGEGTVTITAPVSLAKPVHLGKRPLWVRHGVDLGKVVSLARPSAI